MGNKNGNIRAIKRIERALKGNDRKLTTGEVYDVLLSQLNHKGRLYTNTVTMQELSNLLSFHEQFINCSNDILQYRLDGSSYTVAQWELVEGENEKTEPDN